MWLLIVMAVHLDNPQDIPGRVEIVMPSQEVCQQAITTIKYELKFRSYKIEAQCIKQESLS
jgi:hypothetical protein